MAQASLSTGSRSHLLHVSRDDGQEVRVPWSTGICQNGRNYIPGRKKTGAAAPVNANICFI
jgi:hypothetical protein